MNVGDIAKVCFVGGDGISSHDEDGAFAQVDAHFLNEIVNKFENTVLRPTTGWTTRAENLKHQITAFHEEKVMYDHYTRKVMGLREVRDKRAGMGKSEKT